MSEKFSNWTYNRKQTKSFQIGKIFEKYRNVLRTSLLHKTLREVKRSYDMSADCKTKQRKWAHKIGKLQELPTRNIPRLNV